MLLKVDVVFQRRGVQRHFIRIAAIIMANTLAGGPVVEFFFCGGHGGVEGRGEEDEFLFGGGGAGNIWAFLRE